VRHVCGWDVALLIVTATPSTREVVAIGVLSLAVAMGIGRFAFTPLLPLMLRDGAIDGPGGAEWAVANYVGYLVGALTAARFASDPRRGLRLALAGVTLSTVPISLALHVASPGFGMLLRAAAGVFSAWTLVCASSWCLPELARRQVAYLGAWIYTGVGVGIAAVGTFVWLGGFQTASALWLQTGVLAGVGTIWLWLRLPVGVRSPPPAKLSRRDGAIGVVDRQWTMVLCYGIFGFGYIIQATFLPAMAREQVTNPLVFGLAWPLFGMAAAASVAGAARWLHTQSRNRVWAVAQALMAVGTVLPLASRSLGSLAASAVLVGGTFMVTTMAGLQFARERVPANPTPLIARMTMAFALGQIAGPLLVRSLTGDRWLGLDAFDVANALAATLLVASAVAIWYADKGKAGVLPVRG